METQDDVTSPTADEVSTTLEPFRVALRRDGYDLRVTAVQDGVIDLAIDAVDDACEDCLVPEHVMSPMLANALRPLMESPQIRLRYPGHWLGPSDAGMA